MSTKKAALHNLVSITKATESGTATSTYSSMSTPSRSLGHQPSKPESVSPCVQVQSVCGAAKAKSIVLPQLRKIAIRVDDTAPEASLAIRLRSGATDQFSLGAPVGEGKRTED